MNTKLLYLIAGVFLLLGCTKGEDINPEVLTQNHWEKVLQDAGPDPQNEVVYSIDFDTNGTVYYEAIYRDMETKDMLGYLEYFNGSYQIANGKIQVQIQEHYINLGGTFYSDKDKLILMDFVNDTRQFQLRNKNSELHTIMPLYASSLGIIYDRVEK
tara:strand:+ start:227 stop:697 length:471 start_codon:yes stop_codon:yes gene_type:complete